MTFSEWAKDASVNAISLAEESRILFEAGKKERAYYLSHMASEEASKSLILKFMHSLSTPLTELPKVESLLRNHQKKIDFIIELSQADNPELAKKIDGVGRELTQHINKLKNNSMYVTHIDGVIQTPKDAIADLDVESFVSFGESMANFSKVLLTSKPSEFVSSPPT